MIDIDEDDCGSNRDEDGGEEIYEDGGYITDEDDREHDGGEGGDRVLSLYRTDNLEPDG